MSYFWEAVGMGLLTGFCILVATVALYYLLALLVFLTAKYGAIGFFVGKSRFKVLDKQRKDAKENGES